MIIVTLILLGLCLGSFTNALVWRLHEQTQKQSAKRRQQLSISRGRSMCTHCGHQLNALDLVPVLGWLLLKGRCRYCKKPIGWQYPLVEATTALLFVFSYAVWPFGWSGQGILQFAVWLVVLVGFMALAVYDLRWQVLPSKIIYPLGFIALGQVVILSVWQQDVAVALNAIIGVVCLAGLFYGLFQFSNGAWIGGGDVRLAVVIGLLVGGPLKAVLVLFFASTLGILASLPALVSKKGGLKMKIAFGPFLIAATVIVYLFGTSILAWYKQQFLLL